MQHGARGLDHGPDPDRRVGADAVEAIGDRVDFLRAGDLRNQDAVGPRLAGHGDVVDPPWRIEAVDPNQDLTLAESPGRDRLRDLVAREGLGIGRHGILKIENDAVSRQIARLFQRPRIRPRHEQETAAWTDHGLVLLNSSDTMSPIRPDRIRHISIILFEHGLGTNQAVCSGNRYPIFPKPSSNSSVCRPKDLFQPGAYG